LLLQKFNYEIGDKRGSENLVADHFSRILCDRESKSCVSECFPDEQLYAIHPDPWYADIVNYLVAGRIPKGWTKNDRDRFFHVVKFLFGMILICLSTALTKCLGSVFLTMR